MKSELISKRTLNAIEDYIAGVSLRYIRQYFDAEYIESNLEFHPQVSGERRTLFRQYCSTLDFSSWNDVQKFLRVCESIILDANGFQQDDVDKILRFLENDGYKFEDNQLISMSHPLPSLGQAIDTVQQFDAQHMMQQIARIESAIETDDPSLAIGSAKELLESCCKTILDDRNVSIRKRATMPELLKSVRMELKLLPDGIPDTAKGKEHIDLILDGLGNTATGLNRLRNLYGTGHGKNGRVSSVQPRHAKLAVGAATTLVVFFYETHIETLEKE